MSVEAHYSSSGLLKRIKDTITDSGMSVETISVEALAPVDEFHIGGREATETLVEQLALSEQKKVLDIGCGIGGTARFMASTYGSYVTGIDLTQEFVETGNELCRWVGLTEQITLMQGNALSMPFEKERFDGATMIHVGMNIEKKQTLFREIHRVLKPGACFGLYEIMAMEHGSLEYPLPWASEPGMSYLASSTSYTNWLKDAGFKIQSEKNRRAFAIDFYDRMKAKTLKSETTTSLGLHLLMGQSTKQKLGNMLKGIETGAIAPVEILVEKE